jgi:hypothetical protein
MDEKLEFMLKAILNQFPILLVDLKKELTPLMTQNSFLSWDKTNFEFLFNNFNSLQNIIYKLSISLSNLQSNFNNLPDKPFLNNIFNELKLKLSLEHQLLIETYQIINSNSTVLLNLPKLSYFDFNFSSLNNKIGNQFAKLDGNEFLVRNFNRILEMLSELAESLPSLLHNNTFQELTSKLNNDLINIENNLSSNLKLLQTQFQNALVFNLNPIIDFLPNFEQMQIDIKSLNQVPQLVTSVENKLLNKMNPILTLDNLLVNHNVLMSSLQNNNLKIDRSRETLLSFLGTHFGDISSIMENILSNIKLK